jgi:hypothetical protein
MAKVQMAAPIIAAGEVKGVRSLKVIQLIQVDGGVKIAIVSVPESLCCLVIGLLVPMVEQVCDISGLVHSFDFDLDSF